MLCLVKNMDQKLLCLIKNFLLKLYCLKISANFQVKAGSPMVTNLIQELCSEITLFDKELRSEIALLENICLVSGKAG